MATGVWPQWLLSTGPTTLESLDVIDGIFSDLAAVVAHPVKYRWPSNAQFNAVTKGLKDAGVIQKLEGGEYVANSGRVRAISPAFVAITLAANTKAASTLTALTASNAIAIYRHLSVFLRELRSGDLLIPFVSLRSIVEHVAHVSKAVSHALSSTERDLPDRAEQLREVDEMLVKAAYGTKVSWEQFVTNDFTVTQPNKTFAYKPEEDRADRLAKSTLTAVDRLEKHVVGVRALYDLLCEFAHPNVGISLIAAQQVAPAPVANGVQWVEKTVGLGPPLSLAEHAGVVVERALRLAAAVVKHYMLVRQDSDLVSQRLRKLSQSVIREVVRQQTDVFKPYDPCPCGESRKFKFCCSPNAGSGS